MIVFWLHDFLSYISFVARKVDLVLVDICGEESDKTGGVISLNIFIMHKVRPFYMIEIS